MELLGFELDDNMYLVLAIVAIIVGVLIVKKVAGCLIRLVVLAIVAAVLYGLFLGYTAEETDADTEPTVEIHD